MLIEIFTDGRILLDGQEVGSSCRAEYMLYEYLNNPQKFENHINSIRQKKVA